VDEVVLIGDTISHYAPVLIATLSIGIRRAGVQKKFVMRRASGLGIRVDHQHIGLGRAKHFAYGCVGVVGMAYGNEGSLHGSWRCKFGFGESFMDDRGYSLSILLASDGVQISRVRLKRDYVEIERIVLLN
jgi:hypothetical protein